MNLNDLSEKELDELESYINNRTKKDIVEIKILFRDLRSGKLRHKNVDSDALNFVYDGLTNLFEDWLKKERISNNPSLTNIQISTDLNMLFDRKLQYSNKDNNLQNIVEKLLRENNYPKRSKNIKLPGTREPNKKFIKDGHLYLLRGAEYGQMSGFFAYTYCQSKLNLEEYCKRNVNLKVRDILQKHFQMGKEYFISATTKLPMTTRFAHRVGNKNGSVYILKMKINDVFALEPHKPLFVPNFIDLESFNEEEYIIPDYIMPNEILEEFEYTDYMGVFKYLTETVGLDITPQDVGFVESIEQEKYECIKEGDFMRETEEKYFSAWEKQDYNSVVTTIFEELGKRYNNGGRE